MLTELSLSEIAESTGLPATEEAAEVYSAHDWTVRRLSRDEENEEVLSILKTLKAEKPHTKDPGREETWQRGWAETLSQFRTDPAFRQSLVAQFTRPTRTLNIQGEFFTPVSPKFEINFQALMRTQILTGWFSDVQNLYEFGSGTGINLLAAGRLLPEASIFGSDFVASAVELHNEIARYHSLRISSTLVDMRKPGPESAPKPGAGVFTYGAVEQLGEEHEVFIDFLIEARPALVVFVETDSYLIRENRLADYLTCWYSEQRGYPSSLLGTLLRKVEQGRIEILSSKRGFLSTFLTPGENVYVWRPTVSLGPKG